MGITQNVFATINTIITTAFWNRERVFINILTNPSGSPLGEISKRSFDPVDNRTKGELLINRCAVASR